MSKVALLGLGKYQKEQSHEIWWTYPWPHGNSRWIYGRGAIMAPPPGKIGLNKFDLIEKYLNQIDKVSRRGVGGPTLDYY